MPKLICLVDSNDNIIGAGTREEALQKGIAHRVVRIFLFNAAGELLVQKRAHGVASLPDRWDQSAAGHVDANEDYLAAAHRELKEELGISALQLHKQFKYYSIETDDWAPMKRFNMLYTSTYDGVVSFNRLEVSEVRWISLDMLRKWMFEAAGEFTQGFLKGFAALFDGARI